MNSNSNNNSNNNVFTMTVEVIGVTTNSTKELTNIGMCVYVCVFGYILVCVIYMHDI